MSGRPPESKDGNPSPTIPTPTIEKSAIDRMTDLLNLATEHSQNGRLEESENLLNQLLAIDGRQPAALQLKGIVAFKRGRIEESLALMEQSIGLSPNPLYFRNICEVYRTLGRYDEAIAAGKKAVEMSPNDPFAFNNLGIIHADRLELDESIACSERALQLDPNMAGAHFELAEALLTRGQFERGWEEYEWRFRLENAPQLMPPTDKPQWDGSPIPDGWLLLIADQGYGDVIQFSRYIDWAAERCPNIALACSGEMHSVVTQSGKIRMLFDHWEQRPDFVAFCPLSGLPRLHGTRLDNIPASIPYLRPDPALAASWAERLDALVPQRYRRIGLVWAGRPTHNNDRNRSTALGTFGRLGTLRDTALVSLQKGPSQSQIGTYFGRAPLLNLGPEIRDYADTMAIIASLDMVVTVDTSVGHLCGAMGKPVWIMLPYAPDWRWMLNRSDTPWYPTAKLFRQPAPQRWDDVVHQIVTLLSREAPGPSRPAG